MPTANPNSVLHVPVGCHPVGKPAKTSRLTLTIVALAGTNARQEPEPVRRLATTELARSNATEMLARYDVEALSAELAVMSGLTETIVVHVTSNAQPARSARAGLVRRVLRASLRAVATPVVT